jgi:acyl-CoA thioesterase FadM
MFMYIRIDRISSRSFNVEYRFVKDKNGQEEIAAEGSTLMVCYDYQLNTSIVMPEAWRKRIAEYEGLAR